MNKTKVVEKIFSFWSFIIYIHIMPYFTVARFTAQKGCMVQNVTRNVNVKMEDYVTMATTKLRLNATVLTPDTMETNVH